MNYTGPTLKQLSVIVSLLLEQLCYPLAKAVPFPRQLKLICEQNFALISYVILQLFGFFLQLQLLVINTSLSDLVKLEMLADGLAAWKINGANYHVKFQNNWSLFFVVVVVLVLMGNKFENAYSNGEGQKGIQKGSQEVKGRRQLAKAQSYLVKSYVRHALQTTPWVWLARLACSESSVQSLMICSSKL